MIGFFSEPIKGGNNKKEMRAVTKSVVLGIAGGTGSGKTTVAREIVRKIGADRIAYLEHDAYYRDLAHLSREDRRRVNFDHPDLAARALIYFGMLFASKRGCKLGCANLRRRKSPGA